MTDINTILEKAKELSLLMKDSELACAYNTAKAAFDADGEVGDLIGKFNLARMNLTQESQKETPDGERIAQLQTQTQTLYETIMQQPTMKALDKANLALEDMVRQVNQILQSALAGGGCTHDCSTCGGCS